MHKNQQAKGRRSTRLFISIPIVITAKDAHRKDFQESTRTLVVNKHGAKIMTAHQLTMGTEVLIENRALGTIAKASVVWLGEKHDTGNEVGLQLLDAENIWGIEFPPGDWSAAALEEEAVPASPPPAARPAGESAAKARAPQIASAVKSPAAPSAGEDEAGARRLAQQLENSVDEEAKRFQERLEKVTERIGMEMEVDLRERARSTQEGNTSALRQEVQGLTEQLHTAREKITSLEAQIQTLHAELETLKERQPALSSAIQDLRAQMIALPQSALDSLRRAAEAGFKEYCRLLENELPSSVPANPQETKPEASVNPSLKS